MSKYFLPIEQAIKETGFDPWGVIGLARREEIKLYVLLSELCEPDNEKFIINYVGDNQDTSNRKYIDSNLITYVQFDKESLRVFEDNYQYCGYYYVNQRAKMTSL